MPKSIPKDSSRENLELIQKEPLREFSRGELGIEDPIPRKNELGFVENGVNTSEEMRRIALENPDLINGIIDAYLFCCSNQDRESLTVAKFAEQVVEDNNFVLGKGLTHQKLAEPLSYFMTLFEKGLITSTRIPVIVLLKGLKYEVYLPSIRSLMCRRYISIRQVGTDESLSFEKDMLDFIESDGFYGFRNKKSRRKYDPLYNRIEPEDIIKCFPYLAEEARKRLDVQEDTRDDLRGLTKAE
ncbi:MAG: hypothetical protein PHU71_02435 [Candidatus Gracilibacteria bacterium]|nr:hypothetical protein [Candidatus Gracilibacteria bacterium]